MKKISIIIISVLCLIFSSCSNQDRITSTDKNSSYPKSSNSDNSTQNASQDKETLETTDVKRAKFKNYNYDFKIENEQTVAIFTEKFLPRDDEVVVGAIRDVIKQSFREDVKGKPDLVNQNGINKIHLDNEINDFYVNLIKQDTGEVHSLIVERQPK